MALFKAIQNLPTLFYFFVYLYLFISLSSAFIGETNASFSDQNLVSFSIEAMIEEHTSLKTEEQLEAIEKPIADERVSPIEGIELEDDITDDLVEEQENINEGDENEANDEMY